MRCSLRRCAASASSWASSIEACNTTKWHEQSGDQQQHGRRWVVHIPAAPQAWPLQARRHSGTVSGALPQAPWQRQISGVRRRLASGRSQCQTLQWLATTLPSCRHSHPNKCISPAGQYCNPPEGLLHPCPPSFTNPPSSLPPPGGAPQWRAPEPRAVTEPAAAPAPLPSGVAGSPPPGPAS